MLESVGKKLEQARLQKNLSVEEAAFATKIRPERILDLEKDDYRNFANLTYAKSFLMLYAKFLEVNVADYTATLGKANPVGTGDYEYLSHSPETPLARQAEVSGNRSVFSFLAIVLLLLAAALVLYFLVSFQRITGRVDEKKRSAVAEQPAVSVSEPPIPTVAQAPVSEQAGQEQIPVAAARPVETIPASEPANSGTLEVRRAEPVQAVSVELSEVLVEPVRKTWVRIQRESTQAPPVYDDFLDPQQGSISFQGSRFWISVGEKSAVKISRQGVPVGENDPVVTVQ